ncbi:MAG: alpha/beta hydrolase [Paludibacter sp.]|nr:alpha/beta hydrolase [Paludibacter sp.]
MQKKYFSLMLFVCAFCYLTAQTQKEIIYKEINGVKLKMLVNTPENITESDTLPAMIFFFGGGWETGNVSQFQYYAQNYAKKGLITIQADYRISSVHGTTPFESLKDAKSAIKYLKQHAGELQIDTTRLIASGGSAGGHLAAACFTNETINEDTDPMQITAKPKVLVLFNPVVDNSVNGYGYDRLGDRWEEFSPLHNIRSPFPPTIFFLGTKDNIIPVSTGQLFKQKVEEVGGRCDLKLYEGVGHGFFNQAENRDRVILDVDTFLRSVGCLAEDERMTQTISFPSIPTKLLTDEDFNPGAVASSGLPVSYSSSDALVATIVNGNIHIVGKGSAVIKAYQPGNENYSPAPDVSRVLIVSSEAEEANEYWIDINFTRDSTLWKTTFPPMAVNGLNFQTSLNGTYLGYNCAGAFGKFAVSNYVYTPNNAENLNEKFIYSFRLSTNKTNQWIFPVLPNIGKIKVHYLNGSNVGSTVIPIQKNIAETGQSPNWVDFDPKIEITAPVHGFSANSYVFEKELNLNEITQLRFAPSSTYNFCIYAVSISKIHTTDINEERENNFKLNLSGHLLRIISDTGYSADIFNIAGLQLGSIKTGELFRFSNAGHYLVQINMADKRIIRKIAVM